MTVINENRMNISETDAWGALYQDLLLPLQDGEKTIPMMIDESGHHMDHHTMKKQVDTWIKEGKLVSVGRRICGSGRPAEAYKLVI